VESSCDNEAKVAAFVGKEQCVNTVVQCHPSFVEASDYEGKDCLIHPGGLCNCHIYIYIYIYIYKIYLS
jgi:hypothetical protein